jgi:hypothetical protein
MYADAADCPHPEPADDTDEWSDWDDVHPPHPSLGRVCLLTPAELAAEMQP